MEEQHIEFFSDGLKLQGSLYLPDGPDAEKRKLALIPCSGYQGLNSFYPRLFAEALTKKGFPCFGFDYRGFAESEGTRGRVILDEQVKDILSAVTCTLMQLGAEAGDGVGLIGWGMGAALVLQAAARDPRVKSVAALNGFYVGRRWLQSVHSDSEMESILDQVKEDRRRRVRGEPSERIEAFAHYPLDPTTRKHVEVELAQEEAFGHPVTVQFTESILQLNAEESSLSLVNRPVLVAHGKANELHPPSEAHSLYARLSEPRVFLEIQGAHNDFMYADDTRFLGLVEELGEFFNAP